MRLALILLVSSMSLASCANWGSIVTAERSSQLINSSYSAVDHLIAKQSGGAYVAPGRKVLVATIVDLNRLNRSSPFGRLVAEQLTSRLAQLGIGVSELKLRGNLYVSERQGELLLSREVKEIVATHNADAVLVGTYADAGTAVYITLKLVRASDAAIISAYNYAIGKVGTIPILLKDDR